ncbi:MAG TPA: hypothetical protein EYP19_04860, partial [Desulfobacterales bacterium]|nr:hypothetical protein [Desulfobacterales bacterium]
MVLIIIVLVSWIVFFGGGTLRTQKLTFKMKNLQDELRRLRIANEGLRESLEAEHHERARLLSRICTLTGDLEQVRVALSGSRTARKSLKQKYDAEPGPELIAHMLESITGVDPLIKRRLAHEIF